jgi:hypothetical protein
LAVTWISAGHQSIKHTAAVMSHHVTIILLMMHVLWIIAANLNKLVQMQMVVYGNLIAMTAAKTYSAGVYAAQ